MGRDEYEVSEAERRKAGPAHKNNIFCRGGLRSLKPPTMNINLWTDSRSRPKATLVCLALAGLLSFQALQGQTWQTTTGSNWSTAANWGGVLPANDGSADLIFSAAANPGLSNGDTTLDRNWNVNTLTWNATALDSGSAFIRKPVSATTLTLQNGLSNLSGGRVVIQPNVVASGTQTWTIGATSVLAVYGTFSGGTGFAINGGGTLELHDAIAYQGGVNYAGGFQIATGTLAFFQTGDVSQISQPCIQGSITGAGVLVKSGTGTLALSSTANSFSGGTIINGGVLEVRGGTLGTGTVQIDGGTLRLGSYPLRQTSFTMDQSFALGSNNAIIQGRSTSSSLSGVISGPGALSFDYDPTWPSFTQNRFTLSGSNSYSGGTTIGMVSVYASGAGSLGTGAVTLNPGAVLHLGGASSLASGQKVGMQSGSVLVMDDPGIDPASIVDSSPGKTTGGTLSVGGTSYGLNLDMAAIGNGQLFLGSGTDATYTGTSLGAGAGGVYRLGGGSREVSTYIPSLTFAGTDNLFTGTNSMIIGSSISTNNSDAVNFSTVKLKNKNDFTGGVTINAGTLLAGNDQALGSGTLSLYGGALGADGGARALPNPAQFTKPSSNGSFSFSGSDALTLSGSVDLGGQVRTLNGSVSVTLANTIANGGLKLNSGNWTFGGTNTFSGGLTLYTGAVLNFASETNLGAAGAPVSLVQGTLRPSASMTISRPLGVDYNAGGNLDLNGTVLTLTGSFSGGGTLRVTGQGTLKLASSSAGTSLDIASGTVWLLNGTGQGFPTVVRSGAVLTGTGSCGNTTLYSGASLDPGTETPGKLTLNSSLYLSGDSLLDFDLGLTLSDLIVITHGCAERWSGSPGSSPVIVNITDSGGLAPGQTYTLLQWADSSPYAVSGTSFQLGQSPVGGTFEVANNALQFTTTAPVPEPSAIGFLFAGIGLLSAMARQRAGSGGKPRP
jgi:autotransporter-associated beta strand protein